MSLLPEDMRPVVRHQAGERTIDIAREAYAGSGIDVELLPFIEDMASMYSWADLVVCRAGALTVAELCAVGLPALLVPYPHAVDDHQTANARSIDDHDAGWLIPQDGFTPESLSIRLEGFVNLPNTLVKAATAAKALGGRDAADAVADRVEQLSGARPNGGARPATDPVREIAA